MKPENCKWNNFEDITVNANNSDIVELPIGEIVLITNTTTGGEIKIGDVVQYFDDKTIVNLTNIKGVCVITKRKC